MAPRPDLTTTRGPGAAGRHDGVPASGDRATLYVSAWAHAQAEASREVMIDEAAAMIDHRDLMIDGHALTMNQVPVTGSCRAVNAWQPLMMAWSRAVMARSHAMATGHPLQTACKLAVHRALPRAATARGPITIARWSLMAAHGASPSQRAAAP